MGQPKETKYTPQVGYYKPVCGGLILLNQSGDYYVYLSIISVFCPLRFYSLHSLLFLYYFLSSLAFAPFCMILSCFS